VVVIGRNEGARLVRCLTAFVGMLDEVLYVDSGSSDGSVESARALGVTVVELDPRLPFTAARARNEGSAALSEICPDLEFVQFVDGDTELLPGWLEGAARYLSEHPEVGMVSGELRERFPQASPYHRLAAIEWEASAGEIQSTGGNAMVRVRTLREVGGYDARMIAGEDPEFCVRVRLAGYRIVSLDHAMAVHESDMNHFGQWWRRTVRDGHAYAEIVYRQGLRPERYWVRRLCSIVLWGGVVPGIALAAAWQTSGLSLLLLGAPVVMWVRIYARSRLGKLGRSDAVLYANHCVVGKAAQFLGATLFAWNRLVHRRATPLIEHK
jgi:GT2 family glycosyltransferase